MPPRADRFGQSSAAKGSNFSQRWSGKDKSARCRTTPFLDAALKRSQLAVGEDVRIPGLQAPEEFRSRSPEYAFCARHRAGSERAV
jgi:hypothetical protein